jgi:hypothetical protein
MRHSTADKASTASSQQGEAAHERVALGGYSRQAQCERSLLQVGPDISGFVSLLSEFALAETAKPHSSAFDTPRGARQYRPIIVGYLIV